MNKILKHVSVSLAACALLGAPGASAASAASTHRMAHTTVTVTLWNKSPMVMSTKLAYPHRGKGKPVMGIKAVPASVPAGEVTFNATNTSKDLVHEMIVIPLVHPGKPLPYSKGDARVKEDKAGAIGEVSELDPGKSGKLTLHLKPGKYLLICNVANHFASGMWTRFTVK